MLIKAKKVLKEQKTKKKKTEMNKSMNENSKHVIITLNVSGLKKPIKRISECTEKKD